MPVVYGLLALACLAFAGFNGLYALHPLLDGRARATSGLVAAGCLLGVVTFTALALWGPR